jgi:thymidine kinase
MFCGKTEQLISRVLAAVSPAGVIVYKPVNDTRYADSYVHSHNGLRIAAVGLGLDAPDMPHDVGVIAIDEAQFLLSDAVPRIIEAVRAGVRVICAGLDLDCFGRPFGPMPILMAYANEIVKLSGTCGKCPRPSTRSHRLIRSDAAILPGGAETYEPRCVVCFDPKGGA